MSYLIALWRGEMPLAEAFWRDAIAYGTIANIVATAAAIVAVVAGLPEAVAIALFLLPVPYIMTAVVGVVRSANRDRGEWAGAAKIAVIVWGLAMILL